MFDVEDEGTISLDDIGNVLRAIGQSPTTEAINNMKEELNNGLLEFNYRNISPRDTSYEPITI